MLSTLRLTAQKGVQRVASGLRASQTASMSSLRDVLAAQIPKKQEELKRLKSEYGHLSLGNVTVDQAIGGGRDVQSLYYETSLLDAQEVRTLACTILDLMYHSTVSKFLMLIRYCF